MTVKKVVGFVILKQPSVGFFPTLYKIGDSDGPGGLFAGFIPQFLADFLAILSIQAFRFGIELGLRYFVEVCLCKHLYGRLVLLKKVSILTP